MDERDDKDLRDDIFSKAVRAGKRTYFFDIKKTKKDDCYLTITESKKMLNPQAGTYSFDKHKIFLYPEDLQKLSEVFLEVIDLLEKRRNGTLSDEELTRLKHEAHEQFKSQEYTNEGNERQY